MPITRDEALERIAERAKFAALPEVFSRALVMFDDPEVTATQVAKVLTQDAGLVARLLRVANSAYYGGTGNVSTVQQSIVKLGFRTTKAVVMSSAVYSSLSKSVAKGIDLRPFWQHGLEVAVTAMRIAEEICPKLSEETFVAGLLHDMGRVGYAMAFPDEFKEMLNAGPGTFGIEREKEAFGVGHDEVGTFLAGRWNFPELLTAGIGNHHHDPETLPENPQDRVALCVGLADAVAKSSWAGPAAARPECRTRREQLCVLTGISEERLQNIDAQVLPQINEWAQLLEIELGDPLQLLADANRQLFELYQAMDSLNLENERLHAQLIAEETERASLEALKVICATFSHHINNATTTILGRAQLVNLALERKEKDELTTKITQSMKVIENAVDTITGVLGELKCMTRFEKVSYHGRSEIIKVRQEAKAVATTK